MVSDERALAILLAFTDDDALARTFAQRGVSVVAGWHDFFDAAAGLLDPASVERAISRLPRTALVSLAAAQNGSSVDDPDRGMLLPLALVGEDGVPYGAVAARVRALALTRPDAFEPAPEALPVTPADDADAAAAAERAFTTSSRVRPLASFHRASSRMRATRTSWGAERPAVRPPNTSSQT